MTSEVPPNFDVPWSLSDVVLHTNKSDGKEIYACKTALAMFSPYFRALFFGDFKEKNSTSSTKVDCDYDVMIEILKNIHQIGFKYVSGQESYSPHMVYNLYRAADCYDFAFIRNLCREHLEGFPSIQMANAATFVNRYDILMNILMKLKNEKVDKYLNQDRLGYRLNKEEFLRIFEKLVGQPLPKSAEDLPSGPVNLEEVTVDLKNPRVDLTKPWPGSDLMIIADNALGRVLYSNKTVVELMCPNFDRFLCTTDELQLEGPKKYVARIDEEYATMKEILAIIHICKTDGKNDRILHSALLHSMYCASGKDRLDIPVIRNTCVVKLVEHKSIDAVDVLWRLNLDSSMSKAMEDLSIPQLRDWVYRNDMRLSYRKGKGVFAVTPSQKERLFHSSRTCSLIRKFKEQFFEKGI